MARGALLPDAEPGQSLRRAWSGSTAAVAKRAQQPRKQARCTLTFVWPKYRPRVAPR